MHVRAIASARRDLGRNFRSGHRPAVRRNAAPWSMRMDQEIFARSARTRRPVGSASGRPCGRKRRHIGISQRWCVMKCRGGCLEHKASPTRRGRPLQAVISKVIQIVRNAVTAQPLSVAYPSYCPLVCPLDPIASNYLVADVCARFSFVRRPQKPAPTENFETALPFSYCYELQPSKLGKRR